MNLFRVVTLAAVLSTAGCMLTQASITQELNDQLVYAASVGDVVRVVGLLHYGADINSVDWKGHTALHKATIHGHVDVVKLLLSNGATVDLRDVQGCWTALHWAADRDRREIARLLIDHGAAINAQDKDGQTPLDWAVGYGNFDLARFLIAHGAHLSPQIAALIWLSI